MKPIFDRHGHLGGPESINIDDTQYYFGYDYQSDLVVSPPFVDPDDMAIFAADHMIQTDGEHVISYWSELVAASVEFSELSNDTTFRSSEFVEFLEFEGEEVGIRVIDYHLIYILSSIVPGFDPQMDFSVFGQPAYS